MIWIKPFGYLPKESETEKASLAYLISVLSLIVGSPIPIVTLFASIGIYIGFRQSSDFVKWHTTQAMFIQLFAFIFNSIAFVWFFLLFFTEIQFTNFFIAYMLTIGIVNILILAGTIYSASKTRKGIHVEWLFFGPLTNSVFRSNTKEPNI